MLAVRDAKFRLKLDALLVARRAEVANLIECLYERIGVAPPLAPTTVAMGVNSLFDGLRLNILSNPGNMTADDAESVLILFVDALMQLGRPPPAYGARQYA